MAGDPTQRGTDGDASETITASSQMTMFGRDALDAFLTNYGPFAFGIASLLIIWFAIINPELDRKQLDFDTQADLLRQQNAVLMKTEEISRTIKETALILDAVSKRLEHVR